MSKKWKKVEGTSDKEQEQRKGNLPAGKERSKK
jgi:hypothetical protein